MGRAEVTEVPPERQRLGRMLVRAGFALMAVAALMILAGMLMG